MQCSVTTSLKQIVSPNMPVVFHKPHLQPQTNARPISPQSGDIYLWLGLASIVLCIWKQIFSPCSPLKPQGSFLNMEPKNTFHYRQRVPRLVSWHLGRLQNLRGLMSHVGSSNYGECSSLHICSTHYLQALKWALVMHVTPNHGVNLMVFKSPLLVYILPQGRVKKSPLHWTCVSLGQRSWSLCDFMNHGMGYFPQATLSQCLWMSLSCIHGGFAIVMNMLESLASPPWICHVSAHVSFFLVKPFPGFVGPSNFLGVDHCWVAYSKGTHCMMFFTCCFGTFVDMEINFEHANESRMRQPNNVTLLWSLHQVWGIQLSFAELTWGL